MEIHLHLNVSPTEGCNTLGKLQPTNNGLELLTTLNDYPSKSTIPLKKGNKKRSIYIHKWDDHLDDLTNPINTAYSITFNMSDKHDNFPDPDNEKKFFHKLLLNTLHKGPSYRKAVFVREYSPHSKKLHFHGIVWLYDKKNEPMVHYRENCWQDWTTRRNLACYAICYKKIKDKRHMQDYINYIRKDPQNKDYIYWMRT